MAGSRRDFLKTAGLTGGLLAAGAALAPAAVSAEPLADPWDRVREILARIVPPRFPDRTFDLRSFGAVGDDKKDNTKAFASAISACTAAGGGRVLVTGGTYRTGAIHLRSNVDLHVTAGSTIKFSASASAFPAVYTRWQGIECVNYSPFVYARGQTNLALTGAGTIDGNAQAGPWFDYDGRRGPDWDRLQQMAVDGVPVEKRRFGDGHYLKPNMIQFYDCRNILVEGLSLRNPAMWTVHPVLSENVTVRDVKIHSRGAMVDGVDPESCADVHIHHCSFDTGDDGTVIKSGRDTDGRRVGVPSERIVIEDNDYHGRWGAITIGSEMSGGVRDVFAQRNRIHQGSSYKAFYGLYLKTNKRRGGVIENIHVRDLSGGPVDRGAIFVDMNYSLTGPGFGDIVHPVIRNIDARDIRLDDSPFALKIAGSPESPLTGFRLADSAFTNIDTPKPQISNAKNVVISNVKVNGKPL
ncbi:glycoside hydrolase family 28 protein [Amycolatopsis orientalis]|uniref:glycoside hydrolase family 28 protein n=1 Tax=Amycolatopsis orientalis TaxID=31958 RepID=UPI000424925A|nr:glycoside hydrolase family 28 protein [Amycolatopsis orientalis]